MAHVAMDANSATGTADGIVVLLPLASVDTKSAPATAVTSTDSQTMAIAIDAQSSRTSWTGQPRRSFTGTEGSCEIVDITHLLSRPPLTGPPVRRIRDAADRVARNYEFAATARSPAKTSCWSGSVFVIWLQVPFTATSSVPSGFCG
jgi:hypothetical protein